MDLPSDTDTRIRNRIGGFWLAVAALLLCFSRPLLSLAKFSFQSDLHSYLPLVPLISLLLVAMNRKDLPPPSAPDRRSTAIFLAAGAAVLAGAWLREPLGIEWSRQDFLALNALALVLLLAGLCAWFWGRPILRAIAFPLGFLVLLAPIPLFISNSLETFLQHFSADAAYGFLELTGMPLYRLDALTFQLPGITLNVAPECSGLHSTLALIITSLPAGYFFLRSPWKRAVLSLAAIPLGILRNGFRIFTIAELCVHIGPQMINSYIHRTGGWMFFLISLGVFVPLLLLLARSERPAANA
jgi:exosortase C (VPDSG-CTERM-specific)